MDGLHDKRPKQGWFWSENDLFDHDWRVSSRAKLVYLYLCRRADAERVAFPRLQVIATGTGLSRESVKRSVAELVAVGLLWVEPKAAPGEANVYHLLSADPKAHGDPDQAALPIRGGSAQGEPGSAQGEPRVGSHRAEGRLTQTPHFLDPGKGDTRKGGWEVAERRRSALAVLELLNRLTGRSFRAVLATGRPTASLQLIEARLREGATEDNCRGVVARMVRKWKGDPKMSEYLRPSTLFRAGNFENYLAQRPAAVHDDDAAPEAADA